MRAFTIAQSGCRASTALTPDQNRFDSRTIRIAWLVMQVGSAVIAVPFTRIRCAGSDTTRAAIDYVKLHSRLHIFTVVAAALYPARRRVLCFCDQRYLAHEILSFVRTSSLQKFRRKSGHRSEMSVLRKAAGLNEILRLFFIADVPRLRSIDNDVVNDA